MVAIGDSTALKLLVGSLDTSPIVQFVDLRGVLVWSPRRTVGGVGLVGRWPPRVLPLMGVAACMMDGVTGLRRVEHVGLSLWANDATLPKMVEALGRAIAMVTGVLIEDVWVWVWLMGRSGRMTLCEGKLFSFWLSAHNKQQQQTR